MNTHAQACEQVALPRVVWRRGASEGWELGAHGTVISGKSAQLGAVTQVQVQVQLELALDNELELEHEFESLTRMINQ